ncbi:MAG: HAD hydrolase-like protein [Saprospiraceae bacterium]|nr:HAD hydrolase-like protein [Saprospiraceae bacterium]
MIRMVVFDMAGTTIDEDNVVYKCVQKALNEYQIPATLEQVLEFGAGKEKLQAIKDVYAEVMQEMADEITAKTIYDKFSVLLEDAYEMIDMKLFEGLRSTLFFLYKRDVKVVFNTGYTKDVATKILKKVDCIVGRDLDLLVTADMVENSRPAPDMITYALQHFNIKPWECIKVGDSAIDILEGKNAKVKYSIGITTGAQTKEQIAQENPDYIIKNLRELIPIIEDANNTL